MASAIRAAARAKKRIGRRGRELEAWNPLAMLGCHREAAAMELGGLRRHQVTATAAAGAADDEGGGGGGRPLA